jgi:hypothetical protein
MTENEEIISGIATARDELDPLWLCPEDLYH